MSSPLNTLSAPPPLSAVSTTGDRTSMDALIPSPTVPTATASIAMSAITTTPSSENSTLYIFPWGVYARRVLIQLSFKNLTNQFTLAPISIAMTGQFFIPSGELYPSTTVPALQLPDGTLVRQSNAICEYIEETYEGKSLLGTEPLQRARVREAIDLVSEASTHFTTFSRKANSFFAVVDEQSADACRLAYVVTRRSLGFLEDIVPNEGYLAGTEKPSLADVYLAALVGYVVDAYGLEGGLLRGFEKLETWWARMEKMECVAQNREFPEEWILRMIAEGWVYREEGWWKEMVMGEGPKKTG